MYKFTATCNPEQTSARLCIPSVHLYFVFLLDNQILKWIHYFISHHVSNTTSFQLLQNFVWNQRVKKTSALCQTSRSLFTSLLLHYP